MNNKVSARKLKIYAAGIAAAIATLPATSAFADSKLVGSIRIGATYEDRADNDGEFFIRNFGSRLIWTGSNNITDSLEGIARIELGLNPDENARGNSGADRTRQLWAGVKGDFGTVKIGAQYAAFYDMVQSNTDIAWWGSCWTQLECSRETRVLKYNGSAGDLSYAASVEARSDEDEAALDEFEFGVNYGFGSVTVGAAASIHADAIAADGTDDPGGTLIGLLAKGDIGPASVAVTFQTGDEDFANSADDVSNLTIAASAGNFYGLYNQGDSGDTSPFFATLGYTLNLGDSALMYFEAQTVDNDDDDDATIIGRATFKYDF